MIQHITKKLLIMLLISAAITSCNDKKETKDDAKKEIVVDTKKEIVADADHSYDITMEKGSEILEFSKNIPNDEGNALYNDQKMPTGKDGDRKRSIMMSIGKDANRDGAGIFGIFIVNEDFEPITNIKGEGKYPSHLTIRPTEEGDWYGAVSGTLTFSDLKYVLPTPNMGGTCFTLNFEGDFQKNGKKDDIYQGSGTIVLSPKRAMGVYKVK